LQWFEFVLPDGSLRALHVQCAWRLVRDESILVGRADYYRGATADVDPWEDEDVVGSRLRDVGNEAVRALLGDGWSVADIRVDTFGGLVVQLSGGARLEVFPDAAPASHDDWEAWRLFRLRTKLPHFVVKSDGVRRDDAT
jgi:hypothetical protein